MATTFKNATNNAYGTLSVAITDTAALTFTLTAGHSVPNALQWLTIVDANDSSRFEIVLCSAVAANVVTCTRGQQSTVAKTFDAGALVRALITAQAITDIHTAVNAVENKTQKLGSDGNINAAITASSTLGVTGNTTLTGDLAVNGGDLTTNQTTFNLVNATATTVNFGGAATALSVGAAACVTKLQGTAIVGGTSTPRGTLDVGGTSVASTVYFGYGSATLPPLRLVSTRTQNYADAMWGKNLAGSPTSADDNYYTAQTTTGGGYSGIEFRYAGDMKFYASAGNTTANSAVTPTARISIAGSSGDVTLANNLVVGGNVTAQGGGVTAGVAATTRGVFTAKRGTSTNTPGAIELVQSDGTSQFLFVAAGKLRIHTALPTADSDGVIVGTQS
jgi:hypothetical protein